MSKESYINGFIKAANANGVDPRALAKYAPEEYEEKSIVAAIADAIRKRRGMKKKAASENGPKYHTGGYAPEGASVGKLPEFRSDGQVNEADTPRKILQSFEELRDPGVDESLMRSLDERHANYMDAAKKSYHSIYDKVIEWLKGHGNSAKYVIDRPIPANIYSLLTRNFDRSMYNYTNEPPASVSRPFPGRWSNAVGSASR